MFEKPLMKKLVDGLLIILVVYFFIDSGTLPALINSSAETAKDSYHTLESDVFDVYVRKATSWKLKIAKFKDNEEPWVYLGYSLQALVDGYKKGNWYKIKSFKEGSVDKALLLAEKAVEFGPNESQTYAHLARIHIIKGNYDEASDLLQKSIELNQDNFYSWYFSGILEERKRKAHLAKNYLDKAMEITAFSYQKMLVDIHLKKVAKITPGATREVEVGYYNYEAGNLTEAHSEFNKAVEVNPDDADAYYYRGKNYQKMNKLDLALDDLLTSIDINPKNPNALETIGWIYIQNKDYSEAMTYYSRVLEYEPDNAMAYHNRAGLHAKLGDMEQAKIDVGIACDLGYEVACSMKKKIAGY